MLAVMNDTKWNELRLAMYEMELSPKWSTFSDNGFSSTPDREWYGHFRIGGYVDIIHVDIFADDDIHRELIRAEIKKINLPGKETQDGFRVFGYVSSGETVDYL